MLTRAPLCFVSERRHLFRMRNQRNFKPIGDDVGDG